MTIWDLLNCSALTMALALSLSFQVSDGSPFRRRSPYVVKDEHPVPSEWQRAGRAPSNQLVNLRIGLKHGRLEELERHLDEVSDPYHLRYGQHLSADEVNDLVKPTEEADRLAREWLGDHGIHDFGYSSSHDWLLITVPVYLAEALLDTEYYSYRHVHDGNTILRTFRWSLPLHLHEHIEAVHPTNAFFRRQKRASRPGSGSQVPPTGLGKGSVPTYDELVKIDRTEWGHMDIPDARDLPKKPSVSQACNRVATSPLCLQALYGLLGYVPQAPEKIRVGLVNYLDQVNNKSDIETFLRLYRPDAVGTSEKIKTELVANGLDVQTPVTKEQAARTLGLEGNLNAETLMGLAHPIGITAYNVGGLGPFHESQFSEDNRNEPYLEWLQYILAQQDLPRVITTSYADEEQTVPYWYAKRACQGFAQLGARGVSIFFASGDEGVGADDMCLSNNGSNTRMFLPTFPASCPYVTTVGATRGWDPEIVAFDARSTFIGGGGFSNYFPRPRYQKDAVDAYIAGLGPLHDGLYNKMGRGYPDIAVQGYHYITVWNGTSHIIDGTSASSPAAAAIFSLLNDVLVAENKPVLGWLNPWLYSKGRSGFRDVTFGSNPGCNTAGFPAKRGWDAATGLGTPWFPELKALAQDRKYRSTKPWYIEPDRLSLTGRGLNGD